MKKILTILLALLLLCGCGKSQDDNTVDEDQTIDPETETLDGPYFLNLLKNYEVREKNSTKTEDNEEFNAFLDTIFDDAATTSYLYMHSEVKDYKAMGLTKPEVNWGTITYGVDEEYNEKTLEQLNTLLSFDYDSLSLSQQYDYDLLHYSLLETLCGLQYYQYDFLFSDSSSVLDGITTSLMEFNFYDEESVDDYILLLKDLPNYINQIIEYSKAQSNDGIYHTDTMLDATKVYIDSIVDNDGQSLIDSFKENSEYQDKYDEVVQLIKYDVCDAFSTLEDYIDTLYGHAESKDIVLANLDPDYAEFKFIQNSSNNASIDETFESLINFYIELNNETVDEYEKDNESYANYFTYIANLDSEPFNLDAEGMLEYLRNNTSERYPFLDSEYTVSSLTTLGSSTAGYYVAPPLDDLSDNVIRVNANMEDSMTGIAIYEILAHEGFCGHLYQNIYFQNTNPHKFRATQSFIGYTEGYADLAAWDALELLDWPVESYGTYAKYQSTIVSNHVLYSIIDIAVNYYGYSVEDLGTLLTNFGLTSEQSSVAATYMYDYIASIPCTYVRYGVGFLSHYNLREEAKEELGDKFDYVEYSNTILENGPLPFAILEGAVENYIDENK